MPDSNSSADSAIAVRKAVWPLPALALGLSLAAGLLSATFAGDSLGLYFAAIGFLTLLLPPLILTGESRIERALIVAAFILGFGAIWFFAGRSASLGQFLLCLLILIAYALAAGAVAMVLVRLRLSPQFAAAITISIGLAWLTCPIWLSPVLNESLASVLVPLHPLFALNAAVAHLGLWTEHGAIMYHLTTLGQHVPYALARPIWTILFHAGAGALVLFRLAHRRDAENAEETQESRLSDSIQVNRMNIAGYLRHASHRFVLPDKSLVVLFEGFVSRKPEDPYIEVSDFLRRAGGENRNVFRVTEAGDVIWQVEDHHWRGDSSSDPFNVVADMGDFIVGSTTHGFEYRIDKANGAVQFVRFFKM